MPPLPLPLTPLLILRTILTVVALTALAAAARPTPAAAQEVPLQPARSTAAFRDSVGVNVHLNYFNSSYGQFGPVKDALADLGVRWVRDGLCTTCRVQHGRLDALAAAGIRSQLMMGSPRYLSSIEQAVRLAEEQLPGAVGAVEGVNEWDIHGGRWWVRAVRAHQAALHARVKRSPTLSRLPVVGPAVVRKGSREALGDLSDVLDLGNLHPYAGGLRPGWNLTAELALAAAVAGRKPVVAGELGYHNAVDTTTTHPGVSERAAGVYIPTMYLDAFARGVVRTFAYELVDLRDDTGRSTRDYRFGLLRSDWSQKPAYRALRALLRIVGEPTSTAAPAGLRYELTGETEDVRSLLLRDGDGTAHLALWRDVDVWDRVAKRDLDPGTRAVRVRFAEGIERAEVHDVAAGERPVSTHRAPRALDLAVPAQPLLVELTPGGQGAAPEPDAAPPAAVGLRAAYYDNPNLTAPRDVRVDPTVDFAWGRRGPTRRVDDETFSVRWTGQLVSPRAGTHTLHLTGDDGVRLWLDGRLVIDAWRRQEVTEASARVALAPGRAHEIRLEYFESRGNATVRLEWSSAGRRREVVPSAALRPPAG